MVELVDRAFAEQDVARGIDVRAGVEKDLLVVVDVHVLVDDDDRFRQAHQAEPPHRVHHLSRVTGEALADRDDDTVVERAGRWQVVVDDLGDAHPDRRQEDTLGRLREPLVLRRRLADDDRRVDRVASHRDRRDPEDRELLGRGIEAGVVAERPLDADVRPVDPAFEHDLRVSRHLEVDGLALDELHGGALQKTGDHQLADVLREWRARGVRGDRVEAESDGHRDLPVRCCPEISAAVLVDLPVHERRAPVDLLHAVHADVADAGLLVLCDHGRQRDERRRIERPAALDREQVEVDVVARQDDFLAGRLRDLLRHRVGDRLELAERAHLVDKTLWRRQLEDLTELVGEVVELLDAECQAHPLLGTELVDQERMRCTLRVLEQERRAA